MPIPAIFALNIARQDVVEKKTQTTSTFRPKMIAAPIESKRTVPSYNAVVLTSGVKISLVALKSRNVNR